MNSNKIIEEVDKLSPAQQAEIALHIMERLKQGDQVFTALEKIRGRASWNGDAQEYINKLRAQDD